MPDSLLISGMPAPITLTEVGQMRLETISFFLLVFVICALVVRWIWNGLARDFPRLPRLSYRRALGVMVLWGALFSLVLTMISGARELMTPGAWKRDGPTYKLAEGDRTPVEGLLPTRADRSRKLEDLRTLLWAYALTHNGAFPASRDVPEIPPAL